MIFKLLTRGNMPPQLEFKNKNMEPMFQIMFRTDLR